MLKTRAGHQSSTTGPGTAKTQLIKTSRYKEFPTVLLSTQTERSFGLGIQPAENLKKISMHSLKERSSQG
jgi:hypothetical protein